MSWNECRTCLHSYLELGRDKVGNYWRIYCGKGLYMDDDHCTTFKEGE